VNCWYALASPKSRATGGDIPYTDVSLLLFAVAPTTVQQFPLPLFHTLFSQYPFHPRALVSVSVILRLFPSCQSVFLLPIEATSPCIYRMRPVRLHPIYIPPRYVYTIREHRGLQIVCVLWIVYVVLRLRGWCGS